MIHRYRKNRAFTLVELLVVISIIAVLFAVLLPALNKARCLARAIKSQSNTRQWGIGAIIFTNTNDDYFPWEGNKDDYMGITYKNDKWWANAIPQMLGQKSYRQISESAIQAGSFVPMPPDSGSFFVDPAAQFPNNFTKSAVNFYDSVYQYAYQLFFCYVWNSEMNNGPTASIADDIEYVKSAKVKRPGEVVLMIEMRTTNDELDKKDYEYYRGRPLLGRHRGDWKRIARRHLKGSHIVFCDGHSKRVKYDWATTNCQGSRDPDYPGGDWNKASLIWNAFGPSKK